MGKKKTNQNKELKLSDIIALFEKRLKTELSIVEIETKVYNIDKKSIDIVLSCPKWEWKDKYTISTEVGNYQGSIIKDLIEYCEHILSFRNYLRREVIIDLESDIYALETLMTMRPFLGSVGLVSKDREFSFIKKTDGRIKVLNEYTKQMTGKKEL